MKPEPGSRWINRNSAEWTATVLGVAKDSMGRTQIVFETSAGNHYPSIVDVATESQFIGEYTPDVELFIVCLTRPKKGQKYITDGGIHTAHKDMDHEYYTVLRENLTSELREYTLGS